MISSGASGSPMITSMKTEFFFGFLIGFVTGVLLCVGVIFLIEPGQFPWKAHNRQTSCISAQADEDRGVRPPAECGLLGHYRHRAGIGFRCHSKVIALRAGSKTGQKEKAMATTRSSIGRKEDPMTRRIKWWAAISVAVFIIGALIVIHYSLRIAALMGFAH
jgi:hypothetical protein